MDYALQSAECKVQSAKRGALMDHLLIDAVHPEPAVLARAVDVILAGGVVGYPTDTFYGLAADPRNERAVERLFAIKGRAEDQPIPLIAADLEQVEREAGRLTDLGRRLAERFWPGPLTLLIEASPRILPSIHCSTGKVAVRVPAHVVARLLATSCECAITSTSANLAGDPPANAASGIAWVIGARVDMLLDAGATPGGLPSTIVDVTGHVPVLVRQGVVPWARVLECL